MASIKEKILAVLSDRKTESQAIVGAALAESVGIPISNVSVYLSDLKKDGYVIERNNGSFPRKYWLPDSNPSGGGATQKRDG